MLDNLKERIYDTLNFEETADYLEWAVTIFLIALILLNVIVAILDTVQELSQFQTLFYQIEVISLIIFTVEYGLRVWTCTVNPKYQSPLKGRLLFVLTPFLLIDFVAIFPSYIALYTGITAVDFLFLRSIRLIRVLRVFKLGRYNEALETVQRVIWARRGELFIVYFVGGIIVILSASIMYLVEFHNPSGMFDSIPEAMWWAVTTLTTVGYGDVVPVTPLGKVIGSIIALTGVAFIALPAGILGAGFREELQRLEAKPQTTKQKPAENVYISYEIRKLADLVEDGHMTEQEFEEQKARLLKKQ